MVPTLSVDLAKPPEQRWLFSEALLKQAQELLRVYLTDLGLDALPHEFVREYISTYVSSEHAAEMDYVAQATGHDLASVALVNLYYDALKLVLGCSAFAVETDQGILHARNLDWWTENDILSKYTLLTQYTKAPAGDFVSVGWPGFVGILSGMAPQRFSITLNAVLSDEPPALAPPISLLLRSVFEEARTYHEAVDRLTATDMATDCLLLVSGVDAGEMVVIERTPTQAQVRHPEGNSIAVTNDYLLIDADQPAATGELMDSSCRRFDRVCELLAASLPNSSTGCREILSDPSVMMSITVQQMVFRAKTGEVDVWYPSEDRSI
ncbi:MAG: C45 family peptidase [Bacteroidota bacterium]